MSININYVNLIIQIFENGIHTGKETEGKGPFVVCMKQNEDQKSYLQIAITRMVRTYIAQAGSFKQGTVHFSSLKACKSVSHQNLKNFLGHAS